MWGQNPLIGSYNALLHCTGVDILDVITHTSFGGYRFRRFEVVMDRISDFSIEFQRRRYDTLPVPCQCVIISFGDVMNNLVTMAPVYHTCHCVDRKVTMLMLFFMCEFNIGQCSRLLSALLALSYVKVVGYYN